MIGSWSNGVAAARELARRIWPPRASALVARFGAPAISVLILLAALIELRATDWSQVWRMVPRSPPFWGVFVLAYLVQPACDFAIYRRLWAMPWASAPAMLRKTVGNELLIGYAGEAYLFGWARRAGHGGRDAIRAVKDVAILSAAMGSVATLIAAAVAAPALRSVPIGIPPWLLLGSLGIVCAPPVAVLLMRRTLFSLPGPMLARIATIHGLRAVLTVGLTALLWALALPGMAVRWWVALSAVKLMVSRLPLVSNRELVFAGVTGLLLGHAGEIAALMAMMAALSVASHMLVGIATGAGEIAGELRRWRARIARAA